mgnify:FL=1|tara:strand:+ start:1002 stop:2387 length:1386 start_codon:yes stop_codon:yes gene_type:complete
MAHTWWHQNPFGLLSQAASDYLTAGSLPSATGRPFLPGITVNPITGDRMTPRQRIEMNKAARAGLLSPDRFGRVRPSKLDNFQFLPGSYLNTNRYIPSETDRIPFLQDVAAIVGPMAEAGEVATNYAAKNIIDPVTGYFAGADPVFQNVDTNYNFEGASEAATSGVSKSLTGEGGVIDSMVGGVENIVNNVQQSADKRKMDREAERFRMAKDPTSYSLNDFKNDFPELLQQGEDTVKEAYSEFRKNYKGGNYTQAKDAVESKIQEIKSQVQDSTSAILENKKKQQDIESSTLPKEEKEKKNKEIKTENENIVKDQVDKTMKSKNLSEFINSDSMLLAISLLASAEKGEGTAEGLLNGLKNLQEANKTTSTRLVTLTKGADQKSLRIDDPTVDALIAEGYVVRPMDPLASMMASMYSEGGMAGMGAVSEADPQAVKTLMDANPSLTRPEAEKFVIEQGLTLG